MVESYTSVAARDAGRPKGRSKMTTIAALNAALTNPAIGSAPVPGDGAIDDHGAEALLTAAWLRANAHRAALLHPPDPTPQIAQTQGWTLGVACRLGTLRGGPGSPPFGRSEGGRGGF